MQKVNMKLFAVVVSICLVNSLAQHLTEAGRRRLREHKEACITETGVDRVEVDMAQNGDWADNQELRCFTLCVLRKMGMMNDNGDLNEVVTRQRKASTRNPERVDEILAKCKDLKGATPCDTGYMVFKCYVEEDLE